MGLDANLKRLLGKANRLEMEVGRTASESPLPGYIAARSGFVDAERQRKALEAFDELVAAFPNDEYCRYLRAGFLMSSAKYSEAEAAYLEIANGEGPYKLPANLMLVIVYWHFHGQAHAQQALDRHNELARQMGQPIHHVHAQDMFAV